MKRHIAATPKCKHLWEKEILITASNGKQTRKSVTAHLEVDDHAPDLLNGWDDLHAFVPEPSPQPGLSVEDEESVRVRENPDTKNRRYVETYPWPVGIPIGQGKTKFQLMHEGQGQNAKLNSRQI